MTWWRRSEPGGTPSADPEIARLAQAKTVAFGGVGFAGTTLPETEAYFALGGRVSGAGAAAVRPELERLLDTATPAGKVYAADLLARIDPAVGRAAWQRLAGDRTEVRTMTGCVLDSTTLAAYAAARLAS